MPRISAFRAAHIVLLLVTVPAYWYALLTLVTSPEAADREAHAFAPLLVGFVLLVTAGYALTLGRPSRLRLTVVAIGDFAWFAFFGGKALLDVRGLEHGAYDDYYFLRSVISGTVVAVPAFLAFVTTVMRLRATPRSPRPAPPACPDPGPEAYGGEVRAK